MFRIRTYQNKELRKLYLSPYRSTAIESTCSMLLICQWIVQWTHEDLVNLVHLRCYLSFYVSENQEKSVRFKH